MGNGESLEEVTYQPSSAFDGNASWVSEVHTAPGGSRLRVSIWLYSSLNHLQHYEHMTHLCGVEPNNLSALLKIHMLWSCHVPFKWAKNIKKKTLWSNQTRPAFRVTLLDNRVKSKQMLFSERKNSLLRKEKMGVWVGVQVDSKYRKKQLQCSLLFQKCDKTENLSSCLYFVPTDAAWKMSWL